MIKKIHKIGLVNKIGFYFILRPLLLILIIDVSVVYLISMVHSLDKEKAYIVILGTIIFTAIFYLFPLLILILNYIIKNNKHQLVFNYNSNNELIEIHYKKRGRKLSFKPNDIKVIESNLSITGYENRYKWFFWDEYFYQKLILNTGVEIFIPCILFDNFNEVVANKKHKKIRRSFPIYLG